MRAATRDGSADTSCSTVAFTPRPSSCPSRGMYGRTEQVGSSAGMWENTTDAFPSAHTTSASGTQSTVDLSAWLYRCARELIPRAPVESASGVDRADTYSDGVAVQQNCGAGTFTGLQ